MKRGLAAWAIAVTSAFAAPSVAAACDVALALTIDVSGSVDPREYRVQMHGLAEALNNGDVRNSLLTASAKVTVMQWSGANRQKVVVPWGQMQTHADIDALVATLRSAPRAYRHFSTAIGDAVLAAAALHRQIAGQCKRAVIDVSGDGPSNEGVPLTDMRAQLSRSQITVNALAIEKDKSDLSGYFQREVITGPGAFVVTAVDFTDYARAIRRKLLREITAPIVNRRRDGNGGADTGPKVAQSN